MTSTDLKTRVRDYWDELSCGEVYAEGDSLREQYQAHSNARYELEPYIRSFAKFEEGKGKSVLEIGVGMGADYVEWAKSQPESLTGIDLTHRAVEHTRNRLRLNGLQARLEVADAENLPYPDDSFDIVYSWGVLHHSPDTARAISEVHRVLRPGGSARIMIYHKRSVTGYLLWLRYALLAGKFRRSLDDIYCHHLESPGTKAFTLEEARRMCSAFGDLKLRTQLSFADLLQGEVGQRHRGPLLTIAKFFWARSLIRLIFRHRGLLLLVEATK